MATEDLNDPRAGVLMIDPDIDSNFIQRKYRWIWLLLITRNQDPYVRITNPSQANQT